MKKDVKILIQFITILLMTVVAGTVIGKFVALNNIEITLVPAGYMAQLVYTAPIFMLVAVVSLVIYIAKLKKGKAPKGMAEYISIYVFAVMAVIISGFCGMYTMADFIPVATGLITGITIILLLAYIQLVEDNFSRIIHKTNYANNNRTLFIFCLYGVSVVLSAFVPMGPIPATVICLLWRYSVKKSYNR